MSSFLGTGGAYGFIQSTSSTSGCSSTLSKSSSVSSLAISTKRARTPRKRPNQSFFEAATLLSTACPTVFSMKNLPKKYSLSMSPLSSSSLSSSDIFVPFPALNDANFLIEEPDTKPSFKFKSRLSSPTGPVEGSCIRPAHPARLCYSDANSDIACNIIPLVGSLLGFRIGRKSGLGFGTGQRANSIQQALRGSHSEEWWKLMPMVQMKDIVPGFNALPSLEKKKTKSKKKKRAEVMDGYVVSKATTATSIANPCKLFGQVKSSLGLKLSYGEVIKAWGDRGSPFASCWLESPTTITTVGENDLLPEMEGGGTRDSTF